ncbi:hypothetical protein SL034_004296 [Vibrio harveyi]|uniref:hypothetical protein n=1 Tax=Vibrio harveyi group TaxID=717610 RepID=UPI00097198B5|nr:MULTISPECIES: hypothetical protein [Vibrio harveyi group]ELY1989208.1 hypothetical protein [Vibrio harveyi]APX10094.1 hypothetical protein BWP24_28305 [Vibrio campbellii]ARR10500.1 hypothetical protein Vc3S01_p40014 [Vibrio campbellii]WCP78858.1 hypothetical protein PPW95_25490 [Vibrio parahaemolyticus]WHP52947.1 hypothetical protein QMY43_25355 [Vibrio parahaemolyticus]
MQTNSSINLVLNPRYIASGFRSQANNIILTHRSTERKLACLLEVISSHIKKHGSECFASTDRITKLYNLACKRYAVPSVSERTISNLIKRLEDLKIIERSLQRNVCLWTTKRHIILNIDRLAALFSGVINWSIAAANAFCKRKLQSSRSTVDNSNEASHEKGSSNARKIKTCKIKTKILSRDKEIEKGTSTRLDYLSWIKKTFKQDVETVHQLYEAAKQGRLKASGAKKLISLNAKHNNVIPERFMKFLNHLIHIDRDFAQKENDRLEKMEIAAFGGTAFEAKQEANALRMAMSEADVATGRAEFYRDRFNRVQIRYI